MLNNSFGAFAYAARRQAPSEGALFPLFPHLRALSAVPFPLVLCLSTATILIITALLFWLQGDVTRAMGGQSIRPFGIVYLLPIALITVLWGRNAGFYAVVISLVSLDFFLVPPVYSFLKFSPLDASETGALALVGGVVTLAVDSLQRSREQAKASAERLRGYTQQLERNEKNTRLIMSGAHCLIWSADVYAKQDGALNWQLNYLDEQAAQLFLPLQVPPGSSYWEQACARQHPDDQELLGRLTTQKIRQGEDYAQEFRCLRADDQWRWLRSDVHVEPLVVEQEAPTAAWRVVGVVTDITEQRFLQGQLVQSEKLAALGELIAGVAHEINNPLAAISGQAQLLAMHPDADVQDDAQRIQEMTQRMSRIIRSLKRYARPEDGVESRRPAFLTEPLYSALEIMGYRLRKAGIELTLDLSEDLPLTTISKGEIEQVIVNLLANAEQALAATPPDERRITISAQARSWQQQFPVPASVEDSFQTAGVVCLVTISDSGSGIPEEVLPRIFDPFFTTKAASEGTGLGLYISFGIVLGHGGILTARNLNGGGAMFTIALPTSPLDTAETNGEG